MERPTSPRPPAPSETNPNEHSPSWASPTSPTSTELDQALIDLSGRNVIVTGGHVGLGLQVTRALAEAGASVVVGSRHPERATSALAGTERAEISRLDLLDPASIDAFATRSLDSGRPLHILVNNAGIMSPAERTLDARGYEAQFATNHLGHFQLTLGLLPALRAAHGARVVNTTSGATRICDIRWEDPHFATGYDGHLASAQSKTANVLFAVELDRRWPEDGIHGYAAHPGIVVGTNLGNSMPADQVQAMHRAVGLVDESGRPVIDPESGKKTPQQGAATLVFGATSPLLVDIGGVYLRDNDISPLDDAADPDAQGADLIHSQNVVPHSLDSRSARRLWELSEHLLTA
ncbi:SDR family NAD(P)-dependent oxidoreductase [Streptomyces sp. NPDC049954]|uniref:SDR family NAD(P)-dependent oxidoreductase n=1 Tax=Streptomyces sp. NPDC049954 TaxID=3155779 RepID=UPI00344A62EB